MTMNQDNQGLEQGDGRGPGDEFVFGEEKKPINRNMVVLLLIALVGSSMIYLMYTRGSSTASQEDLATQEKNQKVAEFIQKGTEDLKTLDATITKMEKDVAVMTADNGAGQVPTRELKTNPFQFDKKPTDLPAPGAPPEEPKALAAKVAAKVQIQMITFSPGSSSCILNNRLCSEGDQITVDDVTFAVKRIARDYVMLSNALGEFKLTVRGGL